jgi:uncharacterized iron-regulated membrane protein
VRATHRWLALLLGVGLLLVTTSGCVLLFAPELERLAYPGHYDATPSARPLAPWQGLAVVRRERPGLGAVAVTANRGVYEVDSADGKTTVSVDPGSGRILGERGHGVLGFLTNLHACALACESYPGYVPVLNEPVPGLGALTVGSLLLGVLGLALLLLVVGGLVLWWPGLRCWRRGLRVRRRHGRFARDRDLHKLVGVAAVPFLAMWAITGANLELPVVGQVGSALLPGSVRAEAEESLLSRPGRGPDITPAQAARAALARTGGGRVVFLGTPPPGAPSATYFVGIAKGRARFAHYTIPLNRTVLVDRRDAARSREVYEGGSVAQAALGDLQWGLALHFGSPVAWPVRLLWLAMGLTPLLLAVTGLSTWLYRRGRRRPRRAEGVGR